MSKKLILSSLLCAAVPCLLAYAKPWYAPKSDGAFIVMAAQADMTTAHIGKEAEDRASTATVKDFGKNLVKDHTEDYQQLTELALKTRDVIPKGIDKQNIRAIAALDRYHGRAYDQALLTHETAEHEKLIKAFTYEAEHGSNPAIKAYANKALPIIERHLHDAQNLLKQHA